MHTRAPFQAVLVAQGAPTTAHGPRRDKPRSDVDTFTALVHALSTALRETRMHWRFEIMTATFLQLLLHSEVAMVGDMEWFFDAVVSDLPPARHLGMETITRLLYILKAPVDDSVGINLQAPTQHKGWIPGPGAAVEGRSLHGRYRCDAALVNPRT